MATTLSPPSQAPAVKTPKRAPKALLYALLGPPDSKEHAKAVSDLVERWSFQLKQLQPYWDKAQRWNKLYMADTPEFRILPDEDWRAKIFVPLPYSGIETKTAILTDILTSVDPQIQAEAILSQNYEPAQKVERLLDYTIRSNHWKGKRLPGLIRQAGIEGTAPFKLTWREDTYEVALTTGPEDEANFKGKLQDAMNGLNIQSPDQVPDMAMDPQGFMDWRDQVNKAGVVQVPEPPLSGKSVVVRYRGPWIDQLSLYDLTYNPFIDDMNDQVLVNQRIVKPRAWVMAKVKSGAWDQTAVEYALKGGSQDNRRSKEDQTIDQLLGISQGNENDPITGDTDVEILEVWQPFSETPYGVILNRKAFVNIDPSKMPFDHCQLPIGLLRNVYKPGRAIGISELQINESLFDEMNTIRGLRLDRTKLETLPAFTYQKGIGMPQQKRKIAPGMLIEGRPGMFSPLFSYAATNAFEDMGLIERNAADANATYDNVKGAPAAIGRVSATDASSRTSLANTRHKLQATGFEDDLNIIPSQSIALFLQKGDSDLRVKVAGAPDIAMDVSKKDILESLNCEFRFRGATIAINRDTMAQKLMSIMKDANPVLTPPELRAVLKTFVDQLGVPNAPFIVSPEGDQFYETIFEMTVAKQKMEQQQMEQAAAAAAAPVPSEVSVQDAGALSQPPAGVAGHSVPPGPPQPGIPPGAAGVGGAPPLVGVPAEPPVPIPGVPS